MDIQPVPVQMIIKETYEEGFHDGYRQAMREMPEIVRCKDCKWGKPAKNAYGEDRIICENGDTYTAEYITIPADWYCADGELKDSD